MIPLSCCCGSQWFLRAHERLIASLCKQVAELDTEVTGAERERFAEGVQEIWNGFRPLYLEKMRRERRSPDDYLTRLAKGPSS